MRLPFVFLASLLPCALVQGQSETWKVPHRGALIYQRTTEHFHVSPPPTRLRLKWSIQNANLGNHSWRYLATDTGKGPAGFEKPEFDDSEWPTGQGEFGPEADRDTQHGSPWSSAELRLRTTFDVGRQKPKAVLLRIDHDDGIRIYCNGKQILANDGYGRGREYVLSGKQLAPFRTGKNLLAVECRNIGGAQYLDLGLATVGALPRGTRSQAAIQNALRGAQQAANRVRSDLFGAFRPPALLMHGDLDNSKRHAAMPPSDLREVGWWIATNLQIDAKGGSRRAVASRMRLLGDLHARCQAESADAEGWQTITARLKTAGHPAPGEQDKRYVRQFVMPHVRYGFEGTLRIRRRLVTEASGTTVTEFHTELTGDLLGGREMKDGVASLTQNETWKLTGSRDNQDAAFRADVEKAIRAGTEALKKLLEQPTADKLRAQAATGANSYHSGRLAIGLLALVKGGMPKDDPVVAAGYAELRKRKLIDTYSLGNAMMAIEALYTPSTEAADIKQGVLNQPSQRQLSAEDEALMQQWTNQLLRNIDTRVDSEYLLRFNYTRGGRYDHSVNQYGLLGLYSSSLCGIELPATTWLAAANHLLADLGESSKQFHLVLTSFRDLSRQQADPELARTVSPVAVRPSGWNYYGPRQGGTDAPIWGAMVCAGITGLSICEAGLRVADAKRHNKLLKAIANARQGAFAWLSQSMTARYHPGWIQRQQSFYYYYLYGLERAGMLSGIALIQDRDWYFEGAMALVLAQQADGEWPGDLHGDHAIERSAMAILFLKKSTVPVVTGK